MKVESTPSTSNTVAAPKSRRASILWGCAVLVFVFFIVRFSFHLAAVRIYHEDECRNVYLASLLGAGHCGNTGAPISLFLFPLMWLSRGASHAVDFFVSARFFAMELFWLNVVLLTVATGAKPFSGRGLAAFLGAVSLAPLWDFGCE